jgi:hypothetical protein
MQRNAVLLRNLAMMRAGCWQWFSSPSRTLRKWALRREISLNDWDDLGQFSKGQMHCDGLLCLGDIVGTEGAHLRAKPFDEHSQGAPYRKFNWMAYKSLAKPMDSMDFWVLVLGIPVSLRCLYILIVDIPTSLPFMFMKLQHFFAVVFDRSKISIIVRRDVARYDLDGRGPRM